MKYLAIALLSLSAASLLHTQSPSGGGSPIHGGSGATSLSESANLPVERIGENDLIGITVYDSPELTRTVRVNADGTIRLPMLQQHIKAAGLYPEELEKTITQALVSEQVLVDPIVTVPLHWQSRLVRSNLRPFGAAHRS